MAGGVQRPAHLADQHRRGSLSPRPVRLLATYGSVPSMATFDAPSRETCSIRRPRTNTPLQAFVTMNDPVYVECSQALARRLIAEGGATPESRVRFGLELCLGRPASEKQIAPLVQLFSTEFGEYSKSEADAKAAAGDTLPCRRGSRRPRWPRGLSSRTSC